jgi:hypothetical protein
MTLGSSGVDVLAVLASTLGLGFLSGFRLYATVLALGLALRFDLFHLQQQYSGLALLGDARILAVAGFLTIVEFLADKVPWIDSAWDSVHTVIRPVAATALAATALGDFDAATKTILALVTGTVALSTHSAKAATRLAVNHSPEPFSNMALSVAEDVAVPATIWLVWAYPFVFLTLLATFLAIFAFLAPKAYRLLRLELASLGALFNRWFGSGTGALVNRPDGVALAGKSQELWEAIHGKMEALPEPMARALRDSHGVTSPVGLRCAATESVRSLKRSVGYLCFAGDQLVFVTRRGFRHRFHSVPLKDIRDFRLSGGLILDDLVLETTNGPVYFDVFKAPNASQGVPQPAAVSS